MQFKNLEEQIKWESAHNFSLIENYVYIYHLPNEKGTGIGRYVLLPDWPDSINDSTSVSFSSVSALGRSAPIQAYSSSGPRTLTVNLTLHRDMFNDVNYDVSNLPVEIGDDYVDTIIKCIQAIALPNYKASSKAITVPKVAVRYGNDIFIKGIVTGSVSVSYSKPILANNKYAIVTLQFDVTEIDPYDANTVAEKGSFRGITASNYWGEGEL